MSKKNIPKAFQFDSLESFKTITEDDAFYIEGYASKSIVDRDWDLIPSEAIDINNFLKNPIILYQHNKSEPVGKAVSIEKRTDGLWMKVLISETAANIKTLITEGILQAFSVGFILKDWEFKDNGVLVYKDIELTETSIVSVPANQDALFSQVKSLNEDLHKERPTTPKENNTMTDLEKLQKEMNELREEKKRLEEEKRKKEQAEKEAKEKAEKEALKKGIDTLAESVTGINDKIKEVEELVETAKKELEEKLEELSKKSPRVEGVPVDEKTIDKFMDKFKDITLMANLFKKECTDTLGFDRLPERVKSVTWDSQFTTLVRDSLLQDIYNNADLFNMFRRIPSEVTTDTLPYMPGLVAQWESSATDQGFEPGKVNIDYWSIMSRLNYNYIVDEEAIVTWMPFIRTDMVRAITQGITKQILNNSPTVTNTYKGATAYAVGAGYQVPIAAPGEFLVGDVDAIRAAMVKYGVRPADLVLVLTSEQFLSLVTADEVSTVDKFGPSATIHTGVVGSVRGIPIVQNDDAPHSPTGGTGEPSGLMMNTQFWLVKIKDFIMEWDKNIVSQRADLVGSARVGFAPAFPLAAGEIDRPIAVVGVNP
jgi:HK97 family phage prohead protease